MMYYNSKEMILCWFMKDDKNCGLWGRTNSRFRSYKGMRLKTKAQRTLPVCIDESHPYNKNTTPNPKILLSGRVHASWQMWSSGFNPQHCKTNTNPACQPNTHKSRALSMKPMWQLKVTLEMDNIGSALTDPLLLRSRHWTWDWE